MELSKSFSFHASHKLPHYKGQCNRLHGHTWRLKVYVRGDINPTSGMVLDYADIKEAIQPIIDELEHRHLGDWIGIVEDERRKSCVSWLSKDFNPTSENVLVAIAVKINNTHLHDYWYRLTLKETCTSSCSLTQKEFRRMIRERSIGSLFASKG